MTRTILLLAGSILLFGAGSATAIDRPSPPTPEEIGRFVNAKATITTRLGTVEVRFFPDLAPMHVKNFISLAEKGFYDGTIFHRIIPGFMIQGGDPRGNGTGGPGYSIPAEFTDKRKHGPGILSMARSRDPDSAGSQFFIVVAEAPWLDGQYSIFGEVLAGMEVVNRIVSAPRNRSDRPFEPVAMDKVEISY